MMHESDVYDSKTGAYARGNYHGLRDFELKFVLKIFEKVFPRGTKLFDILQKKIFDI